MLWRCVWLFWLGFDYDRGSWIFAFWVCGQCTVVVVSFGGFSVCLLWCAFWMIGLFVSYLIFWLLGIWCILVRVVGLLTVVA